MVRRYLLRCMRKQCNKLEQILMILRSSCIAHLRSFSNELCRSKEHGSFSANKAGSSSSLAAGTLSLSLEVKPYASGNNHLDWLSLLSNATSRGHSDSCGTVRILLALVSWFRDVPPDQRRVRLSDVLVLNTNTGR